MLRCAASLLLSGCPAFVLLSGRSTPVLLSGPLRVLLLLVLRLAAARIVLLCALSRLGALLWIGHYNLRDLHPLVLTYSQIRFGIGCGGCPAVSGRGRGMVILSAAHVSTN